MAGRRTYVLVHGAWHGGWCWARVAERLQRQGHRVLTPTLTGLGERVHLASRAVNLDTHIQDVVAVLDAEELSGIVLCGHSYGGMVITGAADQIADRIAALVYLDAFVPEDGQSMQALRPPETNARTKALVDTEGDGWLVPPRSAASFDVERPDDRAWVDRRCVPQPYACMTQPVRLTGAWRRVGVKMYIRATGYRASPFGSFAERARTDPGWRYHDIDCGHDVMIDRPEELTALLARMEAEPQHRQPKAIQL